MRVTVDERDACARTHECGHPPRVVSARGWTQHYRPQWAEQRANSLFPLVALLTLACQIDRTLSDRVWACLVRPSGQLTVSSESWCRVDELTVKVILGHDLISISACLQPGAMDPERSPVSVHSIGTIWSPDCISWSAMIWTHLRLVMVRENVSMVERKQRTYWAWLLVGFEGVEHNYMTWRLFL